MSTPALARGSPRPSRRARFLAVAFLTLLALALRFSGIGYLLPFSHEPDGHIIYQARVLKTGEVPPANEQRFQSYPLLTAWLVSLFPAPELAPRMDGPVALEAELERAAAPCVRARVVVALLSTLVVPATYLLARLFLSFGWSLLAAAFTATSLLDFSFSQQARPHAVLAPLALFAVLAAVRLRQRGTFGAYLVAGITAGLSIGCLHNGLAVLVPLLAAHLLRTFEPGGRKDLKLLVPIACVAASVRIFYPFLFDAALTPSITKIDWQQGAIIQAEHVIWFRDFNGEGFGRMLGDLWSYEPVMGVLLGVGLLGLALAAMRRRADAVSSARGDLLVLLAFVVPYFVAVGIYRLCYERFLIPLLPYIAVVCAFAVVHFMERWGLAARRAWTAAAAIVVLAFPVFAALHLARVRSEPDTISQTARWIVEHTTPGERVLVMPGIDLPLFQSPAALAANEALFPGENSYPRVTYWFRQQRHALESHEAAGPRHDLFWFTFGGVRERATDGYGPALKSLQGDWLVLEVCSWERPEIVKCQLREHASEFGHLVQTIAPYGRDEKSTVPVSYQDEDPGQPIERLPRLMSRAQRMGSTIEIYKLDR